jgi:hypothetical protein
VQLIPFIPRTEFKEFARIAKRSLARIHSNAKFRNFALSSQFFPFFTGSISFISRGHLNESVIASNVPFFVRYSAGNFDESIECVGSQESQ